MAVATKYVFDNSRGKQWALFYIPYFWPLIKKCNGYNKNYSKQQWLFESGRGL